MKYRYRNWVQWHRPVISALKFSTATGSSWVLGQRRLATQWDLTEKKKGRYEIGTPGSDSLVWPHELPWECVEFVLFLFPLAVFVSPFLKLRPVPVFCTLILYIFSTLTVSYSCLFHCLYPTPILWYWLVFALRLKFVEGMKGYWESLVTEGEAWKSLARERVCITKNCLKVWLLAPPCHSRACFMLSMALEVRAFLFLTF